MITVRVNGVADDAALTARDSPVGAVWKLRTTVCGSSRLVTDACVPRLSVAVSVSSRYDGYSWSGALNMPLAMPGHVCSWCVWQLDGQCWITRLHDSADAGSLPACAAGAAPRERRRAPPR